MTPKPLDTAKLEWYGEHAAMIAVAEACWRPVGPSYSWHVFDWMCWKLCCKYPLIRQNDQIINMAVIS